jgi:hypothetical protein
MTSGRWMPKYEFDGWEPCPWAPDTALVGYLEGLEIEVETIRTAYHGHLWIVRGFRPYARHPDILESGYCLKVETAKTRGYNAARRLATPILVQQQLRRQSKVEAERERQRRRKERCRSEAGNA